jgi:phosphatidylglycerol lysyltransferase
MTVFQDTALPEPDDKPPALLSYARLGRWRYLLIALTSVAILALVWTALSKLAGEVTYDDVVRELAATPWSAIAAAMLFTALSFAATSFYDLTALAYIGKSRPWPQVALTSFFAFAVGNIAGFGPLTGGAIRYRFYSALGLDAADVGKVVAFVAFTFGIGVAAVTSAGLIAVADVAAAPLGLPPWLLREVGIAGLAGIAILGLASARGTGIRIGRFTLVVPPLRIFAIQLAAAGADIFCAATALWFLLPDIAMSLPGFVAVYAVAVGLGLLSHVPGGIGVFEAVIVGIAGQSAPVDQVLGALILFRAVYYVLPLIIAALTASVLEARKIATGPLAQVARAGAQLAPPVLSALTFVVGAVLILSGVTPASPDALDFLSGLVPLPLLEGAHFLASVLGLFLLVIARGLAFRLDGAWWAAMVAIAIAAVLSVLKAVALVEAVLLVFLACGLWATRREFSRPSSLTRQALSPVWMVAILTVLITAFAVLMFAYGEVEYGHELWWQFEFSGEAPRSLRALLGVALSAGFIAAWSLIRHARAPTSVPTPDDIARAVAIIERQGHADANLARMGDKALMFSADGRAFIMYAVQARSWVALFDPVGPRDAWPELIWHFVETAREAGGRAVFYQVEADNLALYADSGLQAFKLGEEAHLDLTNFDLTGSRRASLRQSHSRAQRDGLHFEFVAQPDVAGIYDDLARISAAWLDHHSAREKRFSLGAFTRDYVLSQPVAVLKLDGRVLAFATVMTTATRDEATVDLMRFAPKAPNSAMEFLFISLCLHFKEQGFRRFTLGMAPLSGMSDRRAAPLWHKIGRTVFEHGERFYNFRGLRAFKDKFRPEWRPRYLAVPGGIEPALALADTAALIGGGLKGVLGK